MKSFFGVLRVTAFGTEPLVGCMRPAAAVHAKREAGSPLLAAVAVGAAHRLPCGARLCRFARKFVPEYRDRASSARKRAAGTGCAPRHPRCQSQATRLALCRRSARVRRTRATNALSERRGLVGAKPHLRCRAAQPKRLAHRSRRCVERSLFELKHSWPPQADNGPQGCEGEFCASAGLVSSEGSLNKVKATAAGAECPPACGAARATPSSNGPPP